MIWFIVKLIFITLVSLVGLRELYMIYQMKKMYQKGVKIYYFPIVGIWWKMIFWKD